MIRLSDLNRWVILLLLASLTCALSTCSAGHHSPPVQENTELPPFDLPAPSELSRDTSYTDSDRIRLGNEFEVSLPTNLVIAARKYLVFVPVYGDVLPTHTGLSYAMYRFNLAGYDEEPVIKYNWTAAVAGVQELYLGLANWELDAWEWFSCNEEQLLELPSMEPYLGPAGQIIVVPAAYDPLQGEEFVGYSALQYIRIGPRVGRWVIDVVDTTAQAMFVSLDLNVNDLPRIAYMDNEVGDSSLKLARLSFGWEHEVVTEDGDVGYFPSLVHIPDPDVGGLWPLICYYDNTEKKLRLAVAFRDTLTLPGEPSWNWGFSTLPVPDATFGCLATDGTNYAVSYYDSVAESLGYLYHNGLVWIDQTIDEIGNAGFTNSMTLDAAGQPRISYYDASAECLCFAEYTDMAWSYATPDPGSAADVGMVNSLALGPDGNPQISYNDTTHQTTRWAYYDGSAWHTETVFDLEAHSEANSLVVDAEGVPHIACMDSDHNNLMHFWRNPDTEEWLGESLETGGSHLNGYSVSMAISSDGRLHIAYGGYDSASDTDYVLKYAYQVD